jgi:hypothetical protein
MTDTISNWQDIIDSRDVIARIAELEELLVADLIEAEDYVELLALRKLADQGDGIEDWAHGATLIRDSYFVDYAKELADDLGAYPHEATWPYTCIDWDEAAHDLRQDYTQVDFDGAEYWVR